MTECVQAFILVILTILQKFGVTKQNVEAVVALNRDVKRQTGNYGNWKWNSKLLCNLPVGIRKQSRRCSRRCCKWQENEKTGEKYQRKRRTCRHFPGVYLQSQDLHDVISYLKVRQVKILIMSLLTAVPFKIFSTTLTSSFKRKSASLFFVILQINFTAVLDRPFPGSIWICIALGRCF